MSGKITKKFSARVTRLTAANLSEQDNYFKNKEKKNFLPFKGFVLNHRSAPFYKSQTAFILLTQSWYVLIEDSDGSRNVDRNVDSCILALSTIKADFAVEKSVHTQADSPV